MRMHHNKTPKEMDGKTKGEGTKGWGKQKRGKGGKRQDAKKTPKEWMWTRRGEGLPVVKGRRGREFKAVGENTEDERGSGLKGGEGLMRAPKDNKVAFCHPFDSIKGRGRGWGSINDTT
jgi:hypothetical protein